MNSDLKGALYAGGAIFAFLIAVFFTDKYMKKTGEEAQAQEKEKETNKFRQGSEVSTDYGDLEGPFDDERSFDSIDSSIGGSKSKRRSKRKSRKQPKKRRTKGKR